MPFAFFFGIFVYISKKIIMYQIKKAYKNAKSCSVRGNGYSHYNIIKASQSELKKLYEAGAKKWIEKVEKSNEKKPKAK